MVSNFDLNRTALNNQMMGLSTDTKPTTGILPNSLFWELDTNGMYYFDGTQWQSIGGSGGGGGDDLVELEYTVADYKAYLTKTPTELWELLQAGKNFKIVVNSDMAQYDTFNVGDVLISTLYGYDESTNKLNKLSFSLAPFPANESVWNTVTFENDDGVMSGFVAD